MCAQAARTACQFGSCSLQCCKAKPRQELLSVAGMHGDVSHRLAPLCSAGSRNPAMRAIQQQVEQRALQQARIIVHRAEPRDGRQQPQPPPLPLHPEPRPSLQSQPAGEPASAVPASTPHETSRRARTGPSPQARYFAALAVQTEHQGVSSRTHSSFPAAQGPRDSQQATQYAGVPAVEGLSLIHI